MSRARMSRFALCLALLCAAAEPARALQLGETKEQLIARHGAPGAEDHARNVAVYFWEGWSAQLEFQGNVVGKITYRRNWYLQDGEITSLLDSNGGARHWRESSAPNGLARQWSRDDGASATCARGRPLSIVFQGAALTAAYQQGPKVVVPATPAPVVPVSATPAPTYAKTPSFPKPLALFPEPELPVADAPPAPSSQPAATARPASRLQVAELKSETTMAPAPGNPEPKAEPPARTKPVAKPSGAAASDDPNLLGYALGSLACLAAFAVAGWYYFKLRCRAGKAPSLQAIASNSSSAVAESLPALNALRNDQVELFVGEILRRDGYTVELSAALNTDDGIDLMLRRDSETTLVQCKHWKTARVTSREMREFYGAMAAGGAPHGILVTTGTFTPDAIEFAEGKGVELMDGVAVAAKIATVAKPGETLCAVGTWIDDFVAHARVFDPECPVCRGTMVIRHNRASGAPSWSCRNYPRCPGRREPRLDLLPTPAAS